MSTEMNAEMTTDAPAPGSLAYGNTYPPVDLLAIVALGLVVIGGVIMASHVPRHVPLTLPLALLMTAVVLLAIAGVLLVRIKRFAWGKFGLVFKWALLAYGISAGMIGFAFIHDHTRGSALVVVLGMLAVYALSVPTAIAYTVARYANEEDLEG